MAGYLALDLSKRATGWAHWDGRAERPRYGHWQLGSEFTSDGGVFAKLHERMAELHQVMEFDQVWFEETAHASLGMRALRLGVGLITHTESFCHAYGIRSRGIHQQSWRPDFVGRQDASAARKDAKLRSERTGKKQSARDTLKALTMERCRQLGLSPRSDDEADAIGILTYSLSLAGVQVPWLAAETLRPMMMGVR